MLDHFLHQHLCASIGQNLSFQQSQSLLTETENVFCKMLHIANPAILMIEISFCQKKQITVFLKKPGPTTIQL
jgi:hypothetical protein